MHTSETSEQTSHITKRKILNGDYILTAAQKKGEQLKVTQVYSVDPHLPCCIRQRASCVYEAIHCEYTPTQKQPEIQSNTNVFANANSARGFTSDHLDIFS